MNPRCFIRVRRNAEHVEASDEILKVFISEGLFQADELYFTVFLLNMSLGTKHQQPAPRLILGLRPANERRRYKVTPSVGKISPKHGGIGRSRISGCTAFAW